MDYHINQRKADYSDVEYDSGILFSLLKVLLSRAATINQLVDQMKVNWHLF